MKSAKMSLHACAFASVLLITGCQNFPTASDSSAPAPAPAPAAATPAPAPAHKEAAAKDDTSKKAEGDVVGTPAPGSHFNKVKLGMGMKEVTDLVGHPTDQGAYVTGKAWVPFYFGADRYRHELLYKGMGRLVFTGGSGFGYGNLSSGRLIRIIHNANERGYR